MEIDCLILGDYQTNCYIIRKDAQVKDCLIIDTGLDAQTLVDFLKQNRLNPLAVLITHGHTDHIAGLKALRTHFPDIKVYISKLDAEMLTGGKPNLSELTGMPFKTKPADYIVAGGDTIETAGIKLQVIHTPGHTPGGICLYAEDKNTIFVGDSLFADSIGRTDFPGGSMTELVGSIKSKLLTLPDETKVYTGHGPATTIGHEKKYNPFL